MTEHDHHDSQPDETPGADRTRRVPILAGMAIVWAVGMSCPVIAEADTVITIGGAHAAPGDDTTDIGRGWYDKPGVTPGFVDYNRSPMFDVDGHTDGGQALLDQQIKAAYAADPTGQIIVTSHSMGTIVAQKEELALINDPAAPPPSQVTFIEIGSPTRPSGADRYFPAGRRIPVVGYTSTPPTAGSQYDVDVVVGQYDGFADAPRRPRNIVADLNAVAGIAYVHGPSRYSSRADGVVVSTSTNGSGGTTTTYLVPTKQLPLTRPLRAVLPDRVVDRIDKPLRRLIDKGYAKPTRPAHRLRERRS